MQIISQSPSRITSDNPKIHPAVTKILEHANPQAMAQILGASIENDQLFVNIQLKDKKIKNLPSDIEILGQDQTYYCIKTIS